ncbi:MAG: hypothetical protein ACXWGU_13530 [Usitatibacter sp.]
MPSASAPAWASSSAISRHVAQGRRSPRATAIDKNSACSAIQAASTEGQVVAALRSYLSALDGKKTALLPSSLLTVGMDHAREIAQAAVELAARELIEISDEATAGFLRDAATVFSTAAMRLAVLSTGAHKAFVPT